MMVALFVYAYAIGVRSSRAIERRCRDDVAFRVITANQVPDHATIARFRVRHEAGDRRAVRRGAGAVRAGRGWSRSASSRSTARRSRRRRRITRRAATSRSRRRSSRRPRASTRPRTSSTARRAATSCPRGCARAAIAARCCARPSRRWTPSAPRRPRRSRAAAASGWSSAGAGCGRTGSSSATSSPSTPLGTRAGSPATGRGGWSARATTSSPTRCPSSRRASSTSPTPTRATSRPRAAGCRATTPRPSSPPTRSCSPPRSAPSRSTPPTCSRWSRPPSPRTRSRRRHRDARGGVGRRRLLEERRDRGARRAEGIPTLVAPDADRRKEPRPGRRGGLYDFARSVLATDWGKQLYLKRQGSVEPVFGQIKSNRGANRFQRRGQISRQIGMAAADRHPQPPQAPPTPTRHRLARSLRTYSSAARPRRSTLVA